MFRPICPSAFFRCSMSNLGVRTESRTEPFIWTTVLSDSKYSLLFWPVAGIEPATSRWFILTINQTQEQSTFLVQIKDSVWDSVLTLEFDMEHLKKAEGHRLVICHSRLFNAKSIFIHINSSISNNSVYISTQFSSIWLKDRTLSGATTPGQSGPGSDGNKGVLCIPQSSCITRASPSDCFVSLSGHSLGKSYPSAKMQSVYSAVPADWARTKFDTVVD